jgi:hypothetical protein
MPDETRLDKTEVASKSRRDFVRTSARVAVTAPAVSLLLSASGKPAWATLACYTAAGGVGCPPPFLDDFTFGNTNEDIDAIALGSNFNFYDSKPQQDDHV